MVEEGRDDEALKTLQDAVARSPQDASLRLMLANALDRAGKDAEAEYRHVIDLKPDLWIGHFQLGRALLNDSRFDQARDCLARAATLAADKPQVHMALGSAYVGLKDHVRAVKAFDEAYRLKPSNMVAAVKAAQSRSALGKHRDALDMLMNMGRMARRSAIVQRAMGDVYFAMSRWTEAAECYRAMVLNSEEIGKGSPELLAIAQKAPGADAEADARKLHDLLTDRAQNVSANLRSDPAKARNWLRERRAGRAAN
jgi:tetratricopeptide (TPR) repeat protein